MQGGGEADGEWVIDGSKAFITNAGTDITSPVTVVAITGVSAGPHQDGPHKELSSIIVPSGHTGLHRGAALLEGGLVRLGHP